MRGLAAGRRWDILILLAKLAESLPVCPKGIRILLMQIVDFFLVLQYNFYVKTRKE